MYNILPQHDSLHKDSRTMPENRLPLSEYKGMWLFAMFDLPVDDTEARRRYTQFRNALLKDGFMMLQYSVYARYCQSEEASDVHRKRVRQAFPSHRPLTTSH